MTTKYLNTYINGGYTLAATYNNVVIAAGAGASGGLFSNHYAQVYNYGRLGSKMDVGVNLRVGGVVRNGMEGYTSATIVGVYMGESGIVDNYGTINGPASNYGFSGVKIFGNGSVRNGNGAYTGALIAGNGVSVFLGHGTVVNYGTIHSGVAGRGAVYFGGDGTVLNGSNVSSAALIEGYFGVRGALNGTLTNFGSVVGTGGDGVMLGNGAVANLGGITGQRIGVDLDGAGSITNGSATNHKATIIGGGSDGIYLFGAGSVANFGTVTSQGGYGKDFGVALLGGGGLTNGQTNDLAAIISGYTGVAISGGAGVIANFATIAGQGSTTAGAALAAGGVVTNGANNDTGALIEGGIGVAVAGALGTVTNFGTIWGQGSGQYGVTLAAGGSVINGGGTDRAALIESAAGVDISGASGFVANAGTILATADTFAVKLANGGELTNGSRGNAKSLIQGYSGVYLGGGSGLNFGVISAIGDYGVGVRLSGGGYLANGSIGHSGALIEGYQGVYVAGGATVTVANYGTIKGLGAVALEFSSASDVLIVGAGSAFVGQVSGGQGTIILASGTGTISNFGTAALTVSGSMAATTFQNFGTVGVGSGATFADTGAVTIAAGQTVNDRGVLSLGGPGAASIVNAGVIETSSAGVLTLAGAVTNTGTLAANGGTVIVTGAVSGAGVATINGGTLDFTAGFTQNVTFTGTTGVLELAKSQTYTGSITGLSKTPSTSLDLVDIGFVSSSEATFSGGVKSGVLTVTDGTHTARITLIGNYTKATFTASSDGHGGTIVVDPKAKTPVASPLAATHGFIAAAAGLGGSGAAALIHADDAWSMREMTLGKPHIAAF